MNVKEDEEKNLFGCENLEKVGTILFWTRNIGKEMMWGPDITVPLKKRSRENWIKGEKKKKQTNERLREEMGQKREVGVTMDKLSEKEGKD